MILPEPLKKLAAAPTGEKWLARLPELITELSDQWQITVGDPNPASNVSYVAPALRGDEEVVLRIEWPHAESEHEADALRVWNGDGAVRLLATDAGRHALLLERCSPGTPLTSAANVDHIAVLIDLLPRLWTLVSTPFRSLADEAQQWAAHLLADWEAAGRPCERELVDAALIAVGKLSASQGQHVLVHQDLHGENVLSAEREPWLVIDPKPLAGEREFALAPIIRSFEFGHSRLHVLDRLNRLCSSLQLDRERARHWAIAQTMAWSFDSSYAERHFETARWLLAANE